MFSLSFSSLAYQRERQDPLVHCIKLSRLFDYGPNDVKLFLGGSIWVYFNPRGSDSVLMDNLNYIVAKVYTFIFLFQMQNQTKLTTCLTLWVLPLAREQSVARY